MKQGAETTESNTDGGLRRRGFHCRCLELGDSPLLIAVYFSEKSSVSEEESEDENGELNSKDESEDDSKEESEEQNSDDESEEGVFEDGAQKSTTEAGNSDCDQEQRLCWICYDAEESSGLVSPCSCKGSVRWVHSQCLVHWFTKNIQGERACCPQCGEVTVAAWTLPDGTCMQEYKVLMRTSGDGSALHPWPSGQSLSLHLPQRCSSKPFPPGPALNPTQSTQALACYRRTYFTTRVVALCLRLRFWTPFTAAGRDTGQ